MTDNQSKGNQQVLIGFLAGISVISVVALIILAVIFIKSPSLASGSGTIPDTANLMAVVSGEHIRGNAKADITIIEWSDFQCPYCQNFNTSINALLKDYSDKVRVVYRHFPLDSIHPYARKSAEASECAGDQNKFWEFHDFLYANQSSIQSGGINFLKTVATNLSLDINKFNNCLDSGKYANLVEQHLQAGITAGVTGTPGSFLNGQELGGAVPYASLQAQVEALLSK
ncbi:MAG: hypothetical protein COU81_00145 [Candidatus Portnoybacteria bacterium CG10_big_fil_rev_8_21_14_0_10_36_7]|uniref:Thioredoxin domain-containing protein n=1 Tax=Candidatus Portnoybacteria bacterium CG10_big_fil_rev_8_21_14_0_10_36_7 TaxID=1974812 RepID=A0A2M8KF38_9BACT|nr:MAG: hypothetical protein COU81_00145 [Candidatus Portnoybacteria bacterium CG10_big_fil_rev_8_21_14_0_10_36_7]